MKLNIFTFDELNKVEATVHHDICGNIFIKINDSYHCLCVDSHDDIEFLEFFNFKPIPNKNIKYSKILNTFEKKSLKGKLIKDLDNQNYDEEEDEIENEGKYIAKYKSYPEDKLYIQDDKSDSDDEYIEEYYEPHYKFFKHGEKTIVHCLDQSLEDLAVYDTFVLNDNTSCVHLTLQAEEKSNYRVSILTTGMFILNIVGSKLKTFKLNYVVNKSNEIEIKTSLIKTQMSI